MSIENGNISINAQNIMPVIKRWLYSDKDIFIRELVANGCDAITKYRMINGDAEDLQVSVTIDKDAGELRFTDNGIGMTADEVHRYINQVAFSSAEEFLKKYQGDDKSGIIGHFGLGFYSAFMAADKVTIDTLSYQEGAAPVLWESEDGMAFQMSEGTRTQRGTTITLHIMEDEKEFLDGFRVKDVLRKYCGFLPTPIFVEDIDGDKKAAEAREKRNADAIKRVEDENKKAADEAAAKNEPVPEPKPIPAPETAPVPEPVNDVHPLWLKAPKDCTDEEYKEFYHRTFHEYDDPLFWVHLNVDYPFNLKGILYFPKLRQDFGTKEGEIKLYSGQMFVADNIKEVIPEFLMLLKGVLDCPDLPLNVSRSFLQNDGYVKKLSAHITKKVADKLTSLFNTQRQQYETYWDDISPFVKYGCIKDAKFYEMVKSSLLYKTTGGVYVTLAEYKAKNGEKAKGKVYYTTDSKRQAASIELYTQREIDVVVLDTIIDVNFISFMEYSGGESDTAFARVDADVSGLTQETDEGKDIDGDKLQTLFRDALDKQELTVKLEAFQNADTPAILTEEEQSRRFRDMSKLYNQPGFTMPVQYTLVLNRVNPMVKALSAMEKGENSDMICQQLFDLARMASTPLEADEITAFLTRSQKILAIMAANVK